MTDIINANIVISSVEDTGTQIKIKDQNKKTFSFFKNKKDGSSTVAYEQFQQYKIGDETGIGYKEVAFTGKDGSPGKIKNILTFGPVRRDQVQQAQPKPEVTYQSTPEIKPRNFDREAYEKCCSIWAAAEFGIKQNPHASLGDGVYWELFQAIRKDGEKRFATGWDKAVKTFGTDTDIEEGNKAIAEAQSDINVDSIPF